MTYLQNAFKAHEVTFKRDDQIIIQKLSFEIQKGSLVALVGPNGGGKSTFLEALALKTPPFSGRLRGLENIKVAYLPQSSTLNRTFPLLVRDIVGSGLWPHLGIIRPFLSKHQDAVAAALHQVRLENFALTPIHALSGGQFQRVLFARFLLQEGHLLLLDEPFKGIDAPSIHILMRVIKEWHTQGKTIIVALHDIDLIQRTFPYTLLLARDFSKWGKTENVLTPNTLSKAYAKAHSWAEACPC